MFAVCVADLVVAMPRGIVLEPVRSGISGADIAVDVYVGDTGIAERCVTRKPRNT